MSDIIAAVQKIENYLDGELVGPGSGEYLDNIDPAVGAAYSLIPDSNEIDVEKAVAAAKGAFGDWSMATPEERHDVLIRLAGLIERDL